MGSFENRIKKHAIEQQHIEQQQETEQQATERDTEQTSSLLQHPQLWRAGQLSRAPQALSSGFPDLDTHLPGGGWPRAGLAELLLDTSGMGELRLLAPLLAHLSCNEARWIAWINPPFVPYAPALSAHGIDISKLLLIHPRNHKDALWALERASRSGACSVTLGWLNERKLRVADTRRLLLAARQGHALTCLFRPSQATAQSSMAELRVQITALRPGELMVSINKRRGGWPVNGLRLRLADVPRPAEIREQLALWRSLRERDSAAQGVVRMVDDMEPPEHLLTTPREGSSQAIH